MTEKKTTHKAPKQHVQSEKNGGLGKPIIALFIIAVVMLGFNQFQIMGIMALANGQDMTTMTTSQSEPVLLGAVDVNELKATGYTVAAVFPELQNTQSPGEVANVMIPTGTPAYGEALGVSYDKPVESLATLARMYRGLKNEVQQNNPEGYARFMNLATKPVGISCEYCCGLNAVGVNANGDSVCGCQHNPALLSVALYLSSYSDYSDAEILREVMQWKTLFFPKDMVQLGSTVAGADASEIANLPGMVGGC